MSKQDNTIGRHLDYPLFKGLQKPLEFMGLQGRYIYWAAGTIVGTIVLFILMYCMFGFVVGLITAVVSVSVGAGFILVKQKKGLHTKKKDDGVFIFAYSKRI